MYNVLYMHVTCMCMYAVLICSIHLYMDIVFDVLQDLAVKDLVREAHYKGEKVR